jgi:nucleoside-diphosphate-sugar epimerase
MTHKNIAIIGCGYIGSETALLWKNQGHRVTSTTRHPEKLKEIAKCSQESVLIQGDNQKEFGALLSANDVLLISVGADHPDEYDTAYLQIARDFRSLAIEMKLPRRLIYTSSTSVYGDAGGQWIDEERDL